VPNLLPQDYVPISECAWRAALPEKALAEALLADGVPLVELKLDRKAPVQYTKQRAFDRWLLANLKPVKAKPASASQEVAA
jgi:hypothetical protein